MAPNPPWSIDELILALDLYFRRGQLGPSNQEVLDLSEEINSLPISGIRSETFRNPNGVAMKLGNFAHFDVSYHGVGLKGGGQRDEQLWNAYENRRGECTALADAIRRGLGDGSLPDVFETDEDTAVEGRLLNKAHFVRERNPGLAKKRKKAMREKLGELRCEICALSEAETMKTFGAFTGDIFECHHKVPLHELDGSSPTRISDLAVLCPNCHTAIHRTVPLLSADAMRERVTSSSL